MAKKYDPQAGSLFKKKVPQMPEGYYSGDKPNPNLRAFVEQHIKERPYDPETDDYDVPAFDKPIETTFELNEIIKAAVPAKMRQNGHPSKQTFQAIRIECNQELEVLKKALLRNSDIDH